MTQSCAVSRKQRREGTRATHIEHRSALRYLVPMTDHAADASHDGHTHEAHPAPGVPTTIRDEAANTPAWVPWVGLVFLVAFVALVFFAAR